MVFDAAGVAAGPAEAAETATGAATATTASAAMRRGRCMGFLLGGGWSPPLRRSGARRWSVTPPTCLRRRLLRDEYRRSLATAAHGRRRRGDETRDHREGERGVQAVAERRG